MKGGLVLPLSLANAGETVLVARVGGRPDVKKHLEDLGFVPGAEISVVSSHEGDMIISSKTGRDKRDGRENHGAELKERRADRESDSPEFAVCANGRGLPEKAPETEKAAGCMLCKNRRNKGVTGKEVR